MVTTKLYGRLANQCYMVANLSAYCLKYDLKGALPATSIDPNKWNREFIHLDTLTAQQNEYNFLSLKENSDQSFTELPFPPDARHVCLDGYWQNEKYFSEYIPIIAAILGFKFHKNTGVIAIHQRRGDYLELSDYHPTVSNDYICMGIKYFYELGYRTFKFFSDDMSYVIQSALCKKFPNCIFHYSYGNSPMQDMQGIASCDHLIGSNSSFSSFSFIMNPKQNKIGVFPKTWLGPALAHINTEGFYPSKSIKL